MLHVARVLDLPAKPLAPNHSVNNLTGADLDQMSAILSDYCANLQALLHQIDVAYHAPVGFVNLIEDRMRQAADLREKIEARA